MTARRAMTPRRAAGHGGLCTLSTGVYTVDSVWYEA